MLKASPERVDFSGSADRHSAAKNRSPSVALPKTAFATRAVKPGAWRAPSPRLTPASPAALMRVERHRMLYQAFLEVTDAGSTPDLLTVQAHLQQGGKLDAVGGQAYLAARELIEVLQRVSREAATAEDGR